MNDSTNLSIDQHITKRVWSSWWEVCSALAWEKTRSGARGALRAASGRWGPRGPTLGKGDLTKAMMVLVKDDFSSSKRWWMFVENRTLFRMVSCFWTWQSTTVDSKTAKPAQSGKGRRIHWRWKDQLQDTILHWKPELISKEQNPCKTSTDQRAKFRWNETEKSGTAMATSAKKQRPELTTIPFGSPPPPKKMLCCRQFRRFHQKTSLLSPSSPKIWRVGGVLFRHNKRGRHFSRFFPAVGPLATHGGMPTTWRSKSKSNSRWAWVVAGVAEWLGLGQWVGTSKIVGSDFFGGYQEN